MSSNTTQLFLNSKQLSEAIGLPVTSIQRLVRQQKIPAYKLDGKQYLFKIEEVQRAIEKRRVN